MDGAPFESRFVEKAQYITETSTKYSKSSELERKNILKTVMISYEVHFA